MKAKVLYTLILLTTCALLSGDRNNAQVSAANQQKRVRFQITAIRESTAESAVLSQTTIEGLPGTDFRVNLQTGKFKLQASFLNELTADNHLKIGTHLETRRFYGYSPGKLPLYEEDSQKQTLNAGFDEKIVLLPFGRNSGDGSETLKIEILPTLLMAENSGEAPLTIKFDKQLPSGEISIEAVKIPHKFTVEATLQADGHPIACGTNNFSLEEENEIALLPVGGTDANLSVQGFKTKLIVDKFIRNRPQDLAGINFDVYRAQENAAQNLMIISHGEGIGLINGEMSYPLESSVLPRGRKYELTFKIRLADNERAD